MVKTFNYILPQQKLVFRVTYLAVVTYNVTEYYLEGFKHQTSITVIEFCCGGGFKLQITITIIEFCRGGGFKLQITITIIEFCRGGGFKLPPRSSDLDLFTLVYVSPSGPVV